MAFDQQLRPIGGWQSLVLAGLLTGSRKVEVRPARLGCELIPVDGSCLSPINPGFSNCPHNLKTTQLITSESPVTIDIHRAGAAAAPEPRGVGLWFIVEGALLFALGILAGVLPTFAGLAAALIFAWMLLLSGMVGFVVLMASRGRTHPIWRIVSAIAAIVAGAVVLGAPLAGVQTIALLVIAYLVVNAVASLALAFDEQRGSIAGWQWRVLTGLIDLVLAAFVVVLRPGADTVMVGYVVAVNLVIGGIAMFGAGIAASAERGA